MRSLFLLCLLWCAAASATLVVPPDAELYSKVKGVLQNQSEMFQRTVKRAGNKTIEFEAFIVTEGSMDKVIPIISDVPHYGDWALPGINVRPSGAKYVLQVLGLRPDPKDKSVLTADLLLDLPVLRKELEAPMEWRTQADKDVLTVRARTVGPQHSYVGSIEGFARFYTAPGRKDRVWLYIKGQAVLRNWLVYEALPERLLRGETAERLQIIMDNYHREEERRSLLVPMKAALKQRR